MIKRIDLHVALLGASLLLACGSENPLADRSALPVAAPSAQSEAAPAAAPEQKLIRTGELQVRVDKVAEAVQRADSIVRANGGLIANSRLSQEDESRRRADLMLRIPAESLNKTVGALKTLGTPTSEATTQQDITRDYVDLETRLAVKEQELARLRELLANRTGKLSDVLEVEREITRVVTDIEQMKGQRRYYDDQVAMSTLTVTLFEAGALRGAPGMSIGIAIRESLRTLNTSGGLLIYFVVLLAPWIIVGAIVRWLIILWRRRQGTSGTQ
ncbi:MAG TPA: DUF4349 domain-containing protein [Gemmatimonadales bacterium]|nr:DUF4349 domain-containing protein [Gemmatimonadales bacterium]